MDLPTPELTFTCRYAMLLANSAKVFGGDGVILIALVGQSSDICSDVTVIRDPSEETPVYHLVECAAADAGCERVITDQQVVAIFDVRVNMRSIIIRHCGGDTQVDVDSIQPLDRMHSFLADNDFPWPF